MKATWRGQVIAESDRTLEVDGYRYFPRETVRMELLHIAPKTASDLRCPHGVQFYDVAADGMRSARAAQRKIVMESTATGMDAETVSPTLSPRYTEEAANRMPRTLPRMSPRRVSSRMTVSGATKGWCSAGPAWGVSRLMSGGV